ncbi:MULTISPECIES: ACP S-malonyltransferase [Bacillaceae]|uniref:ACP S-malonyltransferase n=1 Tax=Bacillaceae TaxID=186817 RepID=UPI000E732A6F|nr:ACP S-malonyltransferase [Bacillus sp. PK3_68]RJS62153.1 [acyl-carrier-protein] S-malonyltransferase [Bacillus sp. PK3_68]
MGKIAFVFPGQGSQAVGMGKALAEEHQEIRELFESADHKLGFSLSELMFDGPEEKLTLTMNAQPAILTASMAALKIFEKEGITPDFVAGHSLGEYTALTAANALTFEDAVYAVHKRGQFMEQAVPAGEGTMAAVLGMDRSLLQEVTEEVTASGETVGLANLNCPGQIVISGTKNGVAKAGELAKEKGAKRVIPLNVSGPFHSSLMKPATEQLEQVLDEVEIKDCDTPLIANVDAKAVTKAEDIRAKLLQQLYSPVLWEDSVETLIEAGVDTFIEIGPGKVLSGLIKKVNRKVTTYAVQDGASIQEAVKALKEAAQ